MNEQSMHFYFEHHDGWFMIIYDLSVDIMDICMRDNLEVPRVCQVKQKLGGLRFYIDGESKAINVSIKATVEASFKTCKVCGELGYLREDGYMQVLCDKHNG